MSDSTHLEGAGDAIATILGEMEGVLAGVSRKRVAGAVEALAAAPRIFVVGEGRSGLMGKAFAMRLMHLGAHVYAFGETITPALERGDLLFAISGSGTTEAVLLVAERARKIGVRIIALTTNAESPLALQADEVVTIPAATKYRREGESATAQPLGSLFDQCAHVVLDAICLGFSWRRGIGQGEAFERHANVE